MKRKSFLKIIITLVLIGAICLMIRNKLAVNQKYKDFRITEKNVQSASQKIELNDNLTVTKVVQTHKETKYYASVNIYAKKASELSINNWYLYENKNIQPDQFDVDYLRINGQATKQMKAGNNTIKIFTYLDPKAFQQYHLTIVAHPQQSKYLIYNFLR
ncbi:hypothetical protein FCS83_02040 [Oenococcus sp. UCMA 17063]|nr:hypothetical protein [Oenococcus sp. UCMA 17063]